MGHYKIIVSSHPKYLASSDILIGDMSDTNYEYIIFDRPIILLSNNWLNQNFPEIGLRATVANLEQSIIKTIQYPDEYQSIRSKWLKKTIYKPDGRTSCRVLDEIIKQSKIHTPFFIILHDNCNVKMSNLLPLIDEIKKRNVDFLFQDKISADYSPSQTDIIIAAHFNGLKRIRGGYKVHLDHGLKGKGTANVEMSKKDYIKNKYFPSINLHITAGNVGNERTKMLLGPLQDRAIIAGYPKIDHLFKYNNIDIKHQVYDELGFHKEWPIITYASAGELSEEKPGGSFSPLVLKKLKYIARNNDINVLVKMKNYLNNVIFLEITTSELVI